MEPGLQEQFLTALRERADLRSLRRYQVDLEDGIKSAVGTEEMAGMIKHMLEKDNTVGHYANHSDEPNAQISIFPRDEGYEIAIVALKPIKKGSKITVNYGPAYWEGQEEPMEFAAVPVAEAPPGGGAGAAEAAGGVVPAVPTAGGGGASRSSSGSRLSDEDDNASVHYPPGHGKAQVDGDVGVQMKIHEAVARTTRRGGWQLRPGQRQWGFTGR
jgi:hypothetical protein